MNLYFLKLLYKLVFPFIITHYCNSVLILHNRFYITLYFKLHFCFVLEKQLIHYKVQEAMHAVWDSPQGICMIYTTHFYGYTYSTLNMLLFLLLMI